MFTQGSSNAEHIGQDIRAFLVVEQNTKYKSEFQVDFVSRLFGGKLQKRNRIFYSRHSQNLNSVTKTIKTKLQLIFIKMNSK
jgi:hypothetical protein